jgi:hypothetical protein
MLRNIGFELLLASPPEYERLVAEIYYDGLFVALVSQERGPGLFEVEMPAANVVESEVIRRVDLPGFVAALEKAGQRLSDRSAEPEE